MKQIPGIVLLFFFAATLLHAADFPTTTAGGDSINIPTAHSVLMLRVGDDGRVYEIHYGAPQKEIAKTNVLARETELYPPFGDGFILEPALEATHADGNTSADLIYVKHSTTAIDGNVSLTRIELRDPAYPFFVTLCFKSYVSEDVIEQWAEIRNGENGAVTLARFASAAPQFKAKEYWLTQFHGDYKTEATIAEDKLSPGIKILDSKIGVRADRFGFPSFILSLNAPADEESGEAIGGSLEWSGSFQLAFDLDFKNRLRALCGINPFASEYKLKPGETFTTPSMLWTWSDSGKGQVSRNFHNWARRYGIRDGDKPRPVLLNNWEATDMNFTEQLIVSLFDGAKKIGADTFLLDDGWFGNAHPRNKDNAGLGDWQANTNKLPHGVSFLASEANKRGINFGIWIEPEMVNPSSDLFEQHPDWAIQQPKRELIYGRNQLDLDLSNPKVEEFVWSVVSNTLSTPGVSYTKWDANRFVNQPGSTYLPPDEQSELLIKYNFALYNVMSNMAKTFPNVMAMACSGGGGRVDYGSMKYFDSFWPSDNTDPVSRIKIQWGFSHFFPAETIAAHVTQMGKRPLKFAIDVAMSGALGVDMDVRKLSPDNLQFLSNSIALYKSEIRDVVEQGDLYRLESPYDSPRAALDYVSADKSRAVLFVYQLQDGETKVVKLRGLDPQKKYLVQEVNWETPTAAHKRQTFYGDIDGATLMRDGFTPPAYKQFDSAVIELVGESEKIAAGK
ncbi:MAG TPA: alpha-galactosidase [Pyrinomonadaceae bacterium]|nr:alpha-galactosidase [Pyrinomonadaceae bacterium]